MQEVAATPGELLADADLIHYTTGAREMRSAECRMVLPSLCPGSPIPKAVTARRQAVDPKNSS